MIHYVLSGMLSSVCTQLLCSYMSFCAINLSIVFFIVKCSISRCVVQSVAALCRVWLHCAECGFVVQSVAACRKGSSNKYEFKFDRVFSPESSQAEVFEEISQLVQVISVRAYLTHFQLSG